MKKILITLSFATLITIFPLNFIAYAASLDGVWVRPSTGAHIQSYSCKGGLGLKIVKSDNKDWIGKVLMCGAKKVSNGQYKGDLTSLEDGRTYTGIVAIKRSKLDLSGCVLGGLICKEEEWPKVK